LPTGGLKPEAGEVNRQLVARPQQQPVAQYAIVITVDFRLQNLRFAIAGCVAKSLNAPSPEDRAGAREPQRSVARRFWCHQRQPQVLVGELSRNGLKPPVMQGQPSQLSYWVRQPRHDRLEAQGIRRSYLPNLVVIELAVDHSPRQVAHPAMMPGYQARTRPTAARNTRPWVGSPRQPHPDRL
jgi:hypothetical protein